MLYTYILSYITYFCKCFHRVRGVIDTMLIIYLGNYKINLSAYYLIYF